MPSNTSKLSINNTDRVMVYIDGSNLYHVLSQNCGRHDLQFDKFSKKLADGRSLRRTYYYNVKQDNETSASMVQDQKKFLDSMYETPFLEVRLGIWKQRGDTLVEKGVDVMLATDLVAHAYQDQFDTAIVVSGDADFYPALQTVKDIGKHIEVAAFDSNLSTESSKVADYSLRLNKTFFTGLWMTRSKARSRAAVTSRRSKVTDEAASPNGEDKALTKSSRPSRPTSTPRKTYSRNKPTDSKSTIRKTPTRRKIGGNSSVNDASSPKPPELRNSMSSEKSDDDKTPGWLGKIGLG
ncbi:MAG: NYN domain-containing protein [Dehalococcoidia bacterium]